MTIRFVKNLLVVGAMAAASVVSALAQSSTLSVNIPFAFLVNGVKFKAGYYVVERADESGTLMIRGQQSAIVQTNSTGDYTTTPDVPGLSFSRNVAGEPVLTKVQLVGEPARELIVHTPAGKTVATLK